MKNDKALSSLGLCAKAGKLVRGVPMICEALAGKNKPILVLEAGDTSENTHKRLTDKCNFYGVEKIKLACGGDVLAEAIGKTGVLGAVAITDRGLANVVKKALGCDGAEE